MSWLNQQNALRRCLWFSGCLLSVWMIVGESVWALEPQMDSDVLFKPLVDTSAPSPSLPPLHAQAERQGQNAAGATIPTPPKTLILTGKVQTLQEAIESERGAVDWYAWYLAARQYLGQTGGIHCALGTPIKFYRDGLIEALSFDSACMASVMGRRFPLPANTKLDALILPVRPGAGPPASRQEIYSRVQSGKIH